MRSLPGSVEIVGFTGALKFSVSRGGLLASSWKLDLDADIADEQPARAFVKVDRRSQKARQQGAQRTQRNQSPRVFNQERGGQIEIASMNFGPRFSRSKLGIHRVIAEVPARGRPSGCLHGRAVPEVRAGPHTRGRHVREPAGYRSRPGSRRRYVFRRQKARRPEASRWPRGWPGSFLSVVESTSASSQFPVLSTQCKSARTENRVLGTEYCSMLLQRINRETT